jgi:sulfate/thiosulfate transport system permease protein
VRVRLRRPSVLPGFGLTMGFALLYFCLLVLIPLAGLFLKTAQLSWGRFWEIAVDPRSIAAYRLSFGAALAAACLNALFGFIVAWVLVRYTFPGKRIIDALVDLPFALPTAVAGIALTAIYSQNGWIGRYLESLGLKVAFTPVGIVVALTFIGLPFVVRTLQPVLQDMNPEIEEAAASLGAERWQTFWQVLMPELWPAVLTGFALALARALGEYGSVLFISGNMPMRTEIAPQLIVIKLEEYDIAGATAIAVVMLVASFGLLLAINTLQWWGGRRKEALAEGCVCNG